MSELKLSLVTINRNDSYMGNSNYRLEVSINYLAEQLACLDRLHDAEYIVVDWGSKVPLHDVLNLSDNAKKITRFILVPVSITDKIMDKSSFPAAMGFNIGIRRSRGNLVGISPADTIFTANLLNKVLSPEFSSENNGNGGKSLFAFARKNISIEIVKENLGIDELAAFLDKNEKLLTKKRIHPYLFGGSGALMMRRSLWFECRGFDENILHWGWSDIDLCLRMRLRYPTRDMSRKWDVYVYHLDHYLPGSTHEKISEPVLNPFVVNAQIWGLSDQILEEFPNKPVFDIFSDIPKAQTTDAHFRRRHWLNVFKFLLFNPLRVGSVLYALKIISIANSNNNKRLERFITGLKFFKNRINAILKNR